MDKNSVKHILVIRLSAMGDVAMIVPVLAAFCTKYPDIKITVLTKTFFKPLFAQLSNVHVIEADVKGSHKGVFGLWRLFKELNVLQIDAVADLHNVLRSSILKTFFSLAGIKVFQINKARKEKKALTRSKDKLFEPLPTTHERYAKVFANMGFPIDSNTASFLKKEKLSNNTLKIVGSNSNKWIGIAPFAAFKSKTYPVNLMLQVVEQLSNTDKYTIFLFGGKEEQKQLEDWEKQYNNCISMAAKLSFAEELSLIANLDLMLSMDSGNGHLAAMYAIPVITLWGVTHPYAGFYPYRQLKENAIISNREIYPLIPTSIYGNKFPKGYEKVMETIKPEKVISRIKAVLGKS